MSMYGHQGVSARDTDHPYNRAYYAKLDELLALGRHPDDAAWEARQHASETVTAVVTAEEAAAIVKALGITYGADAPSDPITPPTTPPKSDQVDAVDWDSAFSTLNANRR